MDVRVGIQILPQHFQQALAQPLGLKHNVHIGRGGPALQQAAQAGLHPALAVLQGEVERAVLPGGEPQKRLPLCHGKAEIQHHPALADLGVTR